MKKKTSLFILFCILFFSCEHRKKPFNKEQWLQEKNRFYMTDSLIEKLNDEKPKRSEIFDFLGKPKLKGRIRDNEVSYWLKSEGFLTIWVLDVHFDDYGNFESATIFCECQKSKSSRTKSPHQKCSQKVSFSFLTVFLTMCSATRQAAIP